MRWSLIVSVGLALIASARPCHANGVIINPPGGTSPDQKVVMVDRRSPCNDLPQSTAFTPKGFFPAVGRPKSSPGHCFPNCYNGGTPCSCCSHKLRDIPRFHPLYPIYAHRRNKGEWWAPIDHPGRLSVFHKHYQ